MSIGTKQTSTSVLLCVNAGQMSSLPLAAALRQSQKSKQWHASPEYQWEGYSAVTCSSDSVGTYLSMGQ